MKVKVSYTTEYEDIPELVKNIIKKSEEVLKELSELSFQLQLGDLGLKSLKDINKMAESATSLAESYTDCQSILSGYLSAAFSPTEEQEDASEV